MIPDRSVFLRATHVLVHEHASLLDGMVGSLLTPSSPSLPKLCGCNVSLQGSGESVGAGVGLGRDGTLASPAGKGENSVTPTPTGDASVPSPHPRLSRPYEKSTL